MVNGDGAARSSSWLPNDRGTDRYLVKRVIINNDLKPAISYRPEAFIVELNGL